MKPLRGLLQIPWLRPTHPLPLLGEHLPLSFLEMITLRRFFRMNRRMMMNLTCGGRGCYRFGVWKNVKVRPRHPTPCLYFASNFVHQCTSTSPAAGKWGHSPKAAQPCNSGLCKSAQQCARVHRGVGGGCTQRGWLCKGGTLCMWKHAACNRAPHFSTCFKLSTAVNVDFERGKTLRLCCVESISMHFNSPIPALSIFGNDFTWPSLKFIIDLDI